MSRAGAAAIRESRARDDFAALIAEKGSIRAAAEFMAKELEDQAIDDAKIAILRLLDRFGIAWEELNRPFVLDDFYLFSPHHRVCVDVEGLLIRYVPASAKSREHLRIIRGRCHECGLLPYETGITDPVAFRADTAQYELAAARFVCRDCRHA